MKVYRYARWDGSQAEFRLEPDAALDALSDLMMEGLDLGEALEWMRQRGFELAGREARVMGAEELAAALAREARARRGRGARAPAPRAPEERLDALLERETRALADAHGFESSRMNEFLTRRHAEHERLSDRIEALRDHAFEDPEAAREYAELLAELERLRALEAFLDAEGQRFRGSEEADYEQAQEIRERLAAMVELARRLREGELDAIDPESLGELLGSGAVDSLVLLRDLEPSLRRAGYLREGAEPGLTPRAIRRLGAQAMAEVYACLAKGRPGEHEVDARGVSLPRPDETRPFVFGDAFDIDPVRSVLEAARRRAREGGARAVGSAIPLSIEDLQVRERDSATQSTTVLLLDMSWSMSWVGRFAAAKRVALALDHLVRTRFPRDHFFVVGFYTRAREIPIRELPGVRWNMGDPFTNLQDGLRVAQRLIRRHPSASSQILVITDGQPTAYFVGRELRVEWPMGMDGVSPRAAEETLREARRVTRQGITINTFMLDSAPALVRFVARMTQINRGRVFYSSPSQLGSYVMVDYLSRRRRRRRV